MDAFGTDQSMSLEELAAAIKQVDVKRTPTSKLPDVIDIIEHLRDSALSIHAAATNQTIKLNEREAFLTQREAELAIRQRAVNSLLGKANPRRWLPWK